MDTGGAGPEAKKCHRLGVSAKVPDVLLDPLERRDLIHQAVVGHLRVLVRRRVGVEKAEDPQPVVDGDHHHLPVACQHPPIVKVARPPAVRLSMHKQHHWQLGPLCKKYFVKEENVWKQCAFFVAFASIVRDIDVEVEAVL